MADRNGDIKFEIVEHIGVIKSFPTGWAKEVNMVSWNGGPAKYDIRDWDHTHERMTKGITLHPDEMRSLLEMFSDKEIKEKKPAVKEPQEKEQTVESVPAAEPAEDADADNAPADNAPAEGSPEESAVPDDAQQDKEF